MAQDTMCFPYERNIVINALYDTIEDLGLCLDWSDSVGGTLVVSSRENLGKIHIGLFSSASKNQTYLECSPKDPGSAFAERWIPVILDEVNGRIKYLEQMEGSEM